MKKYSFVSRLGVLAALTVSFSAQAADKPELEISGFVDAQARWQKVDPENANVGVPGFLLNEGALYLSKDWGSSKVFLDLPVTSEGAADSSFNFATEKAQAFLTWTMHGGLFGFQVGQFDTPIGFEPADSIDRAQTDAGLLGNTGYLPVTHTGLMLMSESKASYGTWNLKAIASNAKNKVRKNSNNFEYALQAAFNADAIRSALSYYFYRNTASQNRQLVDVIVGVTLIEKVLIDLEVAFLKDKTALAANTPIKCPSRRAREVITNLTKSPLVRSI